MRVARTISSTNRTTGRSSKSAFQKSAFAAMGDAPRVEGIPFYDQ
jgi:hypothetical protein